MISQIVIFCSLLILFLVWRHNRIRIRYWIELLNERGWKSTVHYDRCLTVFRKVYDDVNSMEVSINERKRLNVYDDTSYVYGEVIFFSFVRILEKTEPKPGEVFYDLGSGAGKAVVIAALVFDFSKACGIEKLDALYNLSIELQEKLKNLPERQELLHHKEINLQFIHGDMLTQDFSDGDVIFMNATCFSEEMLTKLTAKLLKLKVGARIIVASANFDAIGGLERKYSHLHLMSWGLASIKIYERV